MLDKVVDAVCRWPKPVRLAVGVLLIIGGCFSFLPVLGIWMIPAGMIVLAVDVPFLRPYVKRIRTWSRRAEDWVRARIGGSAAAKRKPRARTRPRTRAKAKA